MHKCPFHSKFVETILARVMSPPNFPVRFRDLRAKILYEDACPAEFRIGSMEVTPIALSHPNNGSGYKFVEDGKTFVFLTDNELGFAHRGGLAVQAYEEFVSGADLLFHDAEYTPEEYAHTVEWGHSTYLEALSLALSGGVKRFGMFHLNQERSDLQVDDMVADCRRRVAQAGQALDCFAVGADMVFEL